MNQDVKWEGLKWAFVCRVVGRGVMVKRSESHPWYRGREAQTLGKSPHSGLHSDESFQILFASFSHQLSRAGRLQAMWHVLCCCHHGGRNWCSPSSPALPTLTQVSIPALNSSLLIRDQAEEGRAPSSTNLRKES